MPTRLQPIWPCKDLCRKMLDEAEENTRVNRKASVIHTAAYYAMLHGQHCGYTEESVLNATTALGQLASALSRCRTRAATHGCSARILSVGEGVYACCATIARAAPVGSTAVMAKKFGGWQTS